MARVRITERNPFLPHQIRLSFGGRNNEMTLVFCNCNPEPLGEVETGADVWAIYNQRPLHSEHREPFTPNNQTWKVYEA